MKSSGNKPAIQGLNPDLALVRIALIAILASCCCGAGRAQVKGRIAPVHKTCDKGVAPGFADD